MLSPVITMGAFTVMWRGKFDVMARLRSDGTGEKAAHDARAEMRMKEAVRMVVVLG